MMILAFGALLGLGILLLLVIANRNSGSRHTDGFYYPYDDATPRDSHSASAVQHGISGHDRGNVGGRDMSHDHHDHGQPGDAGDSGGWGGDAGGGDSGGSGGGE